MAMRIEFMQRRVCDKIATKNSKMDLLLYYWDRITSEIKDYVKREAKGCPPNIRAFCEEIMSTKRYIKKHVVGVYLSQCKVIHQIAFTQWRYITLQLFAFKGKMHFDQLANNFICLNNLAKSNGTKWKNSFGIEYNSSMDYKKAVMLRRGAREILEKIFRYKPTYKAGMIDDLKSIRLIDPYQ